VLCISGPEDDSSNLLLLIFTAVLLLCLFLWLVDVAILSLLFEV